MGEIVCRNSEHPADLDRPARSRSGEGVSGRSDGLSSGHGGAWALWAALSALWRESLADSLRGQGNELLRAVSDWWKGSGGSESVAVAWVGLAADFGRIGSAEEEIIPPRGGETPQPQPAGGRRYAVTACSIRLFPARRCFGARLGTNRGCEAPCAHEDLDPVPGAHYQRECVSAHRQSCAVSVR